MREMRESTGKSLEAPGRKRSRRPGLVQRFSRRSQKSKVQPFDERKSHIRRRSLAETKPSPMEATLKTKKATWKRFLPFQNASVVSFQYNDDAHLASMPGMSFRMISSRMMSLRHLSLAIKDPAIGAKLPGADGKKKKKLWRKPKFLRRKKSSQWDDDELIDQTERLSDFSMSYNRSQLSTRSLISTCSGIPTSSFVGTNAPSIQIQLSWDEVGGIDWRLKSWRWILKNYCMFMFVIVPMQLMDFACNFLFTCYTIISRAFPLTKITPLPLKYAEASAVGGCILHNYLASMHHHCQQNPLPQLNIPGDISLLDDDSSLGSFNDCFLVHDCHGQDKYLRKWR